MRHLISTKSVTTGLVANQPDQPDLNDEGLATRMQLKVATIRSWRCRNPQKLPQCGVKIGRNWLYDKAEVERWISDQRQCSTTKRLPIASNDQCGLKRKTGRPRKHEPAKAKLRERES